MFAWWRARPQSATKISFFLDRIETQGGDHGTHQYSDIESVYVSGSKWGKIAIKGGRKLWLGPKPKGGSADDFYNWLSEKLQGTGVSISLPPGGVGSPYPGNLYVVFGIPLAIYFVLPFVLRSVLGTSSSSSDLLAAGPSLAVFFFLAHRLAVKEDDRAVVFYGERSSPHSFSAEMKAHIFGKGARWIPLILLLEVVGTSVVALLPLLPGENAYFLQIIQRNQQDLGTTFMSQFTAIFANNLNVLARDFVPIYGPLSESAATYNTARVIEITSQNASISPLTILYRLFLLPHSWLELSAYSIGIFESLSIPSSWGPLGRKDRAGPLAWLVDQVALVMIVAVGVLALAGIFEVLEPRMADPYLLWIPISLLLGVTLIAWLRSRPRTDATK